MIDQDIRLETCFSASKMVRDFLISLSKSENTCYNENMVTLTFDTHKAATSLMTVGISKEQAEAIVNLEKEKETSHIPTKADLDKSIADLKIWVLTMMLGQTALIVGLLKLL